MVPIVFSSSIVVTTVDPEVPGSSPKWVPIFYEVQSTAQSLPEPSSLWGSILHWVPEQLNIKGVTRTCKKKQVKSHIMYI